MRDYMFEKDADGHRKIYDAVEIVLIVVITVAIVGLAYTWASYITEKTYEGYPTKEKIGCTLIDDNYPPYWKCIDASACEIRIKEKNGTYYNIADQELCNDALQKAIESSKNIHAFCGANNTFGDC